jgi:hypothetical protein
MKFNTFKLDDVFPGKPAELWIHYKEIMPEGHRYPVLFSLMLEDPRSLRRGRAIFSKILHKNKVVTFDNFESTVYEMRSGRLSPLPAGFGLDSFRD